ncbi:hypothetical protein [Actinomadura sp. NPDC048394]|jgi:hypothetical protein|uniref:hypothetical protein n=1 Tax=Actinomadura sp. NPDC048394 TaxID=3158223 RepID=UPI0033D4FA4E
MAPLYMTPPSTGPIRECIRSGGLGMIATPAQGNRIESGYWWCADNGVFGGAYPGDEAYLRWLASLRRHADRCLFVVAPDVVGDHAGSWSRSRDLLPVIRSLGFPAAFVAQDGAEREHSAWIWEEFDCLFLGGSTEWKLGREAAQIARAASDMGKWVHMGRVNSARRYRYAATECWCDSVDGTYLTYGPDRNLPTVLDWAEQVDTMQECLFGTVALAC